MTPFINRELSWLRFNERVLAETAKPETLALDRLKFLAITASNLDEFCMVRVAYLNDSKHDGVPDDAGLTAGEQLEKVLASMRQFQLRQLDALNEILEDLRGHGIVFLNAEELDESQRGFVNRFFEDEVLPVITPLAIDPSRPFPFLANLSLNIGVRMQTNAQKDVYAVIQVPSILPRFVQLPSQDGMCCFLPMEALISCHLPEICNLHEIKAFGFFRITRSADFDADDYADDLLEEMKRTLQKRKRGRPIRLELSASFDEKMRLFLHDMLHISSRFIFELPGYLDLNAFMKTSSLKGFSHLRLPALTPRPSADFADNRDIFALIRERDRMLHHPYEPFDYVVDFIQRAATDPDVLAIKQTLYRVSGRSLVVAALEQAAGAGKQVTVLVELKARFDEENNIQWAQRLERAGCHVIYGLTGLKTHCKATLVIRREEDGIRRYLHLSTGNYNDVTARLYTDISMFTCRPAFGADASALFNHLTGFSQPPEYRKLVVAPEHLKRFFLHRIDVEIQNARSGLPSGISVKINSLLDSDVILRLYEASQAGVEIKLLVRGICGLLPGVQGVSGNIRVRSIVGRLLEHSRIFVFTNAGEPLVYLGSADLMPRNLVRRVELLFPAEDAGIKSRLRGILDLMWRDNVCAWEMSNDGTYRRVAASADTLDSQLALAEGFVV
ncbi:MAG: polyphosphate kinase 1 [Oscillospiraceae bacterium]|jgi:polyphosphate kinase|nr:polyphosphate kinase 1 [Oscillospiraceae bacterium]